VCVVLCVGGGTVREKKMPDKLALLSRNSPERLKWQFDLWRVARKILRPAHKELLARQVHPALALRL
jgi:hypothetical protein